MAQLMRLAINLAAVLLLLLIGASTHLLCQAKQDEAAKAVPPTPVFADNYHVHGLLSLPYAELNEPFNAYFDKSMERSRADFYAGEYKVYQFGPKSSPASGGSQYGTIYKLVYVPKNFAAAASGEVSAAAAANNGESELHHLLGKALSYATGRRENQTTSNAKQVEAQQDVADDDDDADLVQDVHIATSRTPVKRVCFGVEGGVGFTVGPQSVLPNLHDFTYDSTGRCPHVAGNEHRHARCELWKFENTVGSKRNVYKFWLRRDPNNASLVIPVHYYMLGYDSLLGSHYDRYDISYWNYQSNGAEDKDFQLDIKGNKCGPMPGPGESASAAQRRAHLVAANPIHQFVVQPHVYDHIDHHYAEFKRQFNKLDNDEQNNARGWFNFMHNLRFIHGKNRQLKEFKLAVNKFADENVSSDLRYLRGRRHSTGYNGGLDYATAHKQQHQVTGNGKMGDKLPEYYDWNALGGVTPVKDQAVCGSCWSFGTVGTIEGNYFAKTGKLLRLSQQQLVDCSWAFGNNGCDGGEDFRAYKYIEQAGGLATEEDYGHYKGIDGRCHDQDVERPVKIKGFYNVTTNSVEALQHAIVNYGPVSISIDASQPTFTFYSHGVYFDPKCANSPDSLDHSVLAVGYTKLDGKLVWKVKNSWSTYWGNDGYIYMLAEGNNCGVLDAPTVPIIV